MLSAPVPTAIFNTYWHFAAERQRAFRARLSGTSLTTSLDPVLREYKFTNAYRASDRTSQYLIRHVIYDSQERTFRDTFARILLFKLFNRIDTWRYLEDTVGPIGADTIDPTRLSNALHRARTAGQRIYSAAYIMPSPFMFGSASKHENHLQLLRHMLDDFADQRVQESRCMSDAFRVLLSYPSIGPFLAYQLVIDLNYGPHLSYSEDEFVAAGPGARDGLRKCFSDTGGLSDADLIRWTTERQEHEFEQNGVDFDDLWGRRLQLIDCQNLFCEVDKYARVAYPTVVSASGRRRIKQRFRPNPEQLSAWYPPKWRINDAVQSWLEMNATSQ